MSLDQTPGLVIFDCDGVLVDSEVIANQELVNALASHGLAVSLEQAIKLFSGYPPAGTVAIAEDMLGAVLPDNFWEETQGRTFAAFEKNLKPIGGAMKLVTQLKENGIGVCVASSGDHKKMRLTLGLTGFASLFGGNVFSAEDVARGKPAPDLFLFAAEQMGFEPKDCLVIEDSRPGIDAALAAGMRAILLDPKGRHDLEMKDVKKVTALAELTGCLGQA